MKLQLNEKAPNFSTADVFGRTVSQEVFKGKNIYLAFERNAGCPVCNLRVHALIKKSNLFEDLNTVVVLVYESTPEKMRSYLEGNRTSFYFVADPKNILYDRYGVEMSILKVMKSLFHGIIEKARKGTGLFKKPMKQDGHMARIPSEFLIDPQGNLTMVHYGRFVGDHMSIDFLEKNISRSIAVSI